MNLLDLRLHEKFILFIVHSCIIIFKLALQNPKQTSQKVATFYCGEEEEQLFQDKIEKQDLFLQIYQKWNNIYSQQQNKTYRLIGVNQQLYMIVLLNRIRNIKVNNNIGMLSGQNYKEFILEQGQIEKNIAEGWGYKLNESQYVPRRQKLNTNLKVACIEPLRHIFDIPVSKKLQQVQEELLMLQNQRKLNEMTEKAFQAKKKGETVTEDDSAAIKMMHHCIQEYNFIINHRHIVEKNSEKARKILGIQKSESKELFEKIHSLKSQLGSSTLTNTIKINTEIAKLYKKYSRIVPKSLKNSERFTSHTKSIANRAITSVNNSTSFIGTSKLSPNKKSADKSELKEDESRGKKQSMVQIKDLMIMQELNESEEGDSLTSSRLLEEQLRMQPQSMLINHGFAKLKRRISEYAPKRRLLTAIDAKETQKRQKRERMNTTIQQAYVKKDIIHKGKKLDKIIQEHHDVVDVWKQRINENKQKNNTFHFKFQAKTHAKKFHSLKNTKRNKQAQPPKKEDSQNQIFYNKKEHKAEELKEKQAYRQRIISSILRKKEAKYKRIPGTQILQKNDVTETAKLLLGTANHNDINEDHRQNKKKIRKQQNDRPEWQNLQENDEKLYWSMCKNEKMNILLRSRKQQ